MPAVQSNGRFLQCHCGDRDLVGVRVGRKRVYATARDREGREDTRLGPVLVFRGADDIGWCRTHWMEAFGRAESSDKGDDGGSRSGHRQP